MGKQGDYKLDEKRFQHQISDIVDAQKSTNKRRAIINSIKDVNEEEIVSNITETTQPVIHPSDQKHFDAIFSKPNNKQARIKKSETKQQQQPNSKQKDTV